MFVADLEKNESLKQLKQLNVGDIMYLYTSYVPESLGLTSECIIKVIYGFVVARDSFLKLATGDLDHTKFVVFNLKTQTLGSLTFTCEAASNNVNCVLYDGNKEFWRFIIQ